MTRTARTTTVALIAAVFVLWLAGIALANSPDRPIGDWLQAGIDESIKRYGRVSVPDGHYWTERTLKFPELGGGIVEGTGKSDESKGWQERRHHGTTIHYVGPPDKPAVYITAAGATFRDFAIINETALGNSKQYPGKHPEAITCLYWMGPGSRNNSFYDVRFEGGIGFQAGPCPAVTSDVNFFACVFQNFAKGFIAADNQQVGFNFHGCSFQNGDTAIEAQGGGIISVTGAFADSVQCFFHGIDGGKNNARVGIRDPMFDRSGSGEFRHFVHLEDNCGHRVIVDGLQLTDRKHTGDGPNPDAGKVLFRLGANWQRMQSRIWVEHPPNTEPEMNWEPSVVPPAVGEIDHDAQFSEDIEPLLPFLREAKP